MSTPLPPGQPQQRIPPTPHQEARNVISHPAGPESQLQLGEGIYTLREEIALGNIPPHPSENATPNPNVLDTKPVPPTAGTRLSIAVLSRSRPALPSTLRPLSLGVPSKPNFLSSMTDVSAGESSRSSGDHSSSYRFYDVFPGQRSRFGEGNSSLFISGVKDPKDIMKRKKPKNTITKSSSSFISRAIPSDTLSKRLNEHRLEDTFAFANISRALLWLDLSSQAKQDQLTKILFTKAHPLAHDFNEFTRTPSHMDLIIGFSTSEILWYEPFTQKYSRINKNGVMNALPVSAIRWLPGSENYFVAAHYDGTLAVYDKEREDAPFVPEDDNDAPVKVSKDGKRVPRLIVKKSIQSKNQKNNPLCVWKVANQHINGLEFSPDGNSLAVVSEDGSLRILDFHREELEDLYSSYYGGLTCVCWSPDGNYVLTGGQDDLISIWSVQDRELVARCVGHHSWVSAVMFDPLRCDKSTYRFGSVGEDGRLLLWDFNFGMLARPREPSIRQSFSVDGHPTAPKRKNSEATVIKNEEAIDAKSLSSSSSSSQNDDVAHSVVPRARVAILPPVLSKEVDVHPLSWISFEEDSIIVACKSGHIRTWDRPKSEVPTHSNASMASSDLADKVAGSR